MKKEVLPNHPFLKNNNEKVRIDSVKGANKYFKKRFATISKIG
jgi:hypothetical protein